VCPPLFCVYFPFDFTKSLPNATTLQNLNLPTFFVKVKGILDFVRKRW
jgi:hypothetical protein